MNNEERAQKICEILKIVLVGLTCPFVLPLVVENDRAEANESSH